VIHLLGTDTRLIIANKVYSHVQPFARWGRGTDPGCRQEIDRLLPRYAYLVVAYLLCWVTLVKKLEQLSNIGISSAKIEFM
jgi:hypothetical protein